MRTKLALLALSASACLGQTIIRPIPFFPPALRQYLALSDDQVLKISTLNSQLVSFQISKSQRQAQVQAEIAQETAKPALDSLALGLRYVELEAIRRELQTEQKKTFDQIQTVLTTDQKVRLAGLQQVLASYSTACSAVSQNLLSPPIPVGFDPGIPIPATQWFDASSFLLGPAPCVGQTYVPFSNILLGLPASPQP